MKLLNNNGVTTKMALTALGVNAVNAVQQAPFKVAGAFGEAKVKRNIRRWKKQTTALTDALRLYKELQENGGTLVELDEARSVINFLRGEEEEECEY